MSNKAEVFKPIVNFESQYEFSNLNRCREIESKAVLEPRFANEYYIHPLRCAPTFTHWLVWQYHHDRWPKRGYEIHHIDKDKTNNNIDNLVELDKSQHNNDHNYNKPSQYEGVFYFSEKWLAEIEGHFIGYYKTDLEAAAAVINYKLDNIE